MKNSFPTFFFADARNEFVPGNVGPGQRAGEMKYIQIIDGATNCAFSVYQTSEDVFFQIFPGDRQNVEFIDDLIGRIGERKAGEILAPIWQHRVEKENILGLHGTLFFEMEFKKEFYPNKRESDLDITYRQRVPEVSPDAPPSGTESRESGGSSAPQTFCPP